MEVVYLAINNSFTYEKSACAFGYFDGFHKGHQTLLNKVIEIADNKGLKKSVFTFNQSPKDYLKESKESHLLSLDDKINYLEGLGFDYMYIFSFNSVTLQLTPAQFIKEYIIKLRIVDVICGYDYHFGNNASGDYRDLKQYPQFFSVHIIDKVKDESKKISSTRIKLLLEDGRIEEVNQILDRNYGFKGRVIRGRQIGRTIGFPTANIETNSYKLPKRGVYGGYATVDNVRYKCMINIGYNPTFSSLDHLSLEAHLLNFDQDIYGELVKIEFCFFIRNETKFTNKEELINQLNEDKKVIQNTLK